MPHQVQLTNGAAHWGLGILNQAKTNLADLFVSGSLARKFSPARMAPPMEDGEKPYDYEMRATEWFEQSLGEIEVSNEERDFMRNLLKDMGNRKELPANFHVADLARAFELDKP